MYGRRAAAGRCLAIAFLQKTHKVTPRFLDSVKRAKQQVERCSGYHRVLFIAPHTPLNASSSSNGTALNGTQQLANGTAAVDDSIAALRAILGEGVLGIGPADYALAFGLERSDIKLFSHDLPANITHVWVAEYDVDWTGDLPFVLSVFPPTADYICSTDFKSDGINIGSGWVHFRNHNWLHDSEVKQCFMMLAGYSIRMLRAFQAETLLGHRQFSEIGGVSICHRHWPWCKIESFDRKHEVVGKAKDGSSLYSFNRMITPEMWTEIQASAPPPPQGHIYHALKW
ncbi:hypothetical protein GPECTOR_36g77 [Gonium pectorale]|uniref:Uncharacterized protein n=1 Tax=Gonium pectorale TaxID=33097 RepID=A0A150GBZ3_GONPE|nr:hypothetical protein GPECTOR_36g77 [Gonium pectorale]|eukprot:KXZ47354.1 hypothetical protein GPECTOR_36g77 [Gonium pectorale]